jgi:hypothetical protein
MVRKVTRSSNSVTSIGTVAKAINVHLLRQVIKTASEKFYKRKNVILEKANWLRLYCQADVYVLMVI